MPKTRNLGIGSNDFSRGLTIPCILNSGVILTPQIKVGLCRVGQTLWEEDINSCTVARSILNMENLTSLLYI